MTKLIIRKIAIATKTNPEKEVWLLYSKPAIVNPPTITKPLIPGTKCNNNALLAWYSTKSDLDTIQTIIGKIIGANKIEIYDNPFNVFLSTSSFTSKHSI